MKDAKNPKEGEKRNEKTSHGRWRKNADGTYRYIGVCPFNRAVCKLVNITVSKRARQEA